MTLLSQRDEQVMLAIWALKEDAYLVGIKNHLSDIMGKNWTLGAIHAPLRRLSQLGYLSSSMGQATPQRGGRAKRIYALTSEGMAALDEYKKINDALWGRYPGYELK